MADDAPYPELSDEQMTWFVKLVEAMVSSPEKVICLRVMDGTGLEMALIVAPEDEHIFPPRTCEVLATSLCAVTGVSSPVVYLNKREAQ